MNEIFTFVENNTYNLRNGMYLSRVNVHCTQYGTESISNLGAKNILFYLFLYSFYYTIYVIYVFFNSIHEFIYFINLFIYSFTF